MELKFTVPNRQFEIDQEVIALTRGGAIGKIVSYTISIEYSPNRSPLSGAYINPETSISVWRYEVRVTPRYHTTVNEINLLSVDQLKAEISEIGNLQTAINHHLDPLVMLNLLEGKIKFDELEKWR